MSDRASKALAEPSLPGEPRTYDARSKRSGVPLTTLYYREHGRPSKEEKAQGQQYLIPSEEKVLEKYLKLMADLGNPVRINCLPALTFSIARQRSTNKAAKPLGKNWPRGFQKRHPALKSRRVRAMAWERHENNIYDKMMMMMIVIYVRRNTSKTSYPMTSRRVWGRAKLWNYSTNVQPQKAYQA
jgi:hypothetical protein